MKKETTKCIGSYSYGVSTQMKHMLDAETEARIQGDEALSQRIDTIELASDVTDIVATYADLQAYDTSTLTDNDIIKVLSDSTHDNKTDYYRYSKSLDSFSFIGAIDSVYTKAETDTLLSQKQDTLVSGTNIKTINGYSVLGSGNLELNSHQTFDPTWPTNTTFDAFITAIRDDADAIPGMTYLGELTCSGLPTGISNAEAVVEIMTSAVSSSKCIHVILTSGNVSPYHWEYTYWNNGSNSGWIGFQPQLTAGDDITISNNNTIDVVTDSALSSTSEHPVQNKVIYAKFQETIDGGNANIQ